MDLFEDDKRLFLKPVLAFADCLMGAFVAGPCGCIRCLDDDGSQKGYTHRHTVDIGGGVFNRRFAVSTYSDVRGALAKAWESFYKTVLPDQELAVQRHVPGYRLPYAILFTCTPAAYETRNTSGLRKDLAALEIPMFEVEMKQRDAFVSMFKYKCPLEMLDSALVPGIDTAIVNAEAFAAEVLVKLEPILEK